MPCNYDHLTRDMRLMALIQYNNYDFMYTNLVIIITINFDEDINRSFPELRLDLNSPESELELELKCPELELELELKLIRSSGIGIENNRIGIGIELKKIELTPTLNSNKQDPENSWQCIF